MRVLRKADMLCLCCMEDYTVQVETISEVV